jgi:cathepsin B
MKCFVIAAAILALASAKSIKFNPLSDEHIDHINSLGTTWKAGRNWDPETPIESLRNKLGSLKGSMEGVPIQVKSIKATDIPDTFDAREQWPDCPTISDIRDQADCGSCWAFAAAESISDRYCINFGEVVRISSQELMTCCGYCGYGCDGGYPVMAWRYWVQKGLVTGFLYGDTTTCQPYTLEPCDHHVNGTLSLCPATIDATPACSTTCISEYDGLFETDKHVGDSYYAIVSKNVEQIQTEILNNGPVEATFEVYADFYTYKSGVYQHVSGDDEGGHAVKFIGWGTEDGTDYWLVANSWNEEWGDAGYFKIIRGVDECGIESAITAGLPKQYSA